MYNASNSDIKIISERKKDGIHIPLTKNVQARYGTNYLDYVKLIHNALPEIDYDDINLSIKFLKHNFDAPLIIDSMTGGTLEAEKINSKLGKLAEKYGFAMGLGSQRAGLKTKSLAKTYNIARKSAPSAFLIANIGGAQLSEGLEESQIEKILDMINANALVIHLNPLQELIQPEGEPRYRGVLDKIKNISKTFKIPIIVKEVGSGISKEVAIKLEKAGIDAINIAGSGGTSWAGIEKIRAEQVNNNLKTHLGELFWDWGIPTAVSLIEVKRSVKIPIIASGGIRNGLEIAKCLVLGAEMCAMAYPFLKAASQSTENLFEFADRTLSELKSTMFLTGTMRIPELSKLRYILTDELAERVRK